MWTVLAAKTASEDIGELILNTKSKESRLKVEEGGRQSDQGPLGPSRFWNFTLSVWKSWKGLKVEAILHWWNLKSLETAKATTNPNLADLLMRLIKPTVMCWDRKTCAHKIQAYIMCL